MSLDLSGLTDYAWSDIKKAAKAAMVNSALGGSTLSINGKVITRITIGQAKELYELADMMSNAEDGEGGGIALINFKEPQ